ncbi:hypothetical protein [Litorimonas haliclonae]|uniref:hypothetical protein n=1 Tax=Litorimonas haliclonae TaxID=2081977 RepID=UPI0039EE3EF8
MESSTGNDSSTGYSRIDKIRHILETHQDLEYNTSEPVVEYLNKATAKHFGITADFTDEQQALNTLLMDMNADPHAITLAWGTYIEIMKSETNV